MEVELKMSGIQRKGNGQVTEFTLPEQPEYKILVISDTHGANDLLNSALEKEYPVDLVIHCGDSQGNPEKAVNARRFPVTVAAVCGNCDDSRGFPQEILVHAGTDLIWAVHGNRFHVVWEERKVTLLEEAVKRGADVALYGHTHVPDIDPHPEKNVLIVNPGSALRPKQASRIPTYAVLTLSRGKTPGAALRKLL